MPNFIPDPVELKASQIPYFEDSTSAAGMAGHGTTKSIDVLQSEIRAAIARLGGGVTSFVFGKSEEKPLRYGYQIHFALGKASGRIDLFALPMRKETPSKKQKTLKQALYMLGRMLESQYYASLVMPDSVPLVPYLLGPGGVTVQEAILGTGDLPKLLTGGGG